MNRAQMAAKAALCILAGAAFAGCGDGGGAMGPSGSLSARPSASEEARGQSSIGLGGYEISSSVGDDTSITDGIDAGYGDVPGALSLGANNGMLDAGYDNVYDTMSTSSLSLDDPSLAGASLGSAWDSGVDMMSTGFDTGAGAAADMYGGVGMDMSAGMNDFSAGMDDLSGGMSDISMSDPMTDMGGSLDTGSLDMGSFDAASMDTGGFDAGMDAGMTSDSIGDMSFDTDLGSY